MTHQRFAQLSFTLCFLLIAVGGSMLWGPSTLPEAMVVLFMGTLLALMVWLGTLYAVVRHSRRREGQRR